MGKIGLGIVTCNREDFFKQCYKSVPYNKVDVLVAVNDGDKLKGNETFNELLKIEQNQLIKGSIICKAKDCNKYLYKNQSAINPQYCMDCV